MGRYHKWLFCIAVTGLTISMLGCSSTNRVFDNGELDADAFTQINERAAVDLATLVLVNNDKFSAEGLRMDTDSTSWVDPQSRAFKIAPTSSVRSVHFTDRGRAAMKGLVFGALAGGVLFRAMGRADGDDPPCGPPTSIVDLCISMTTQEKGALSGGAGAIVFGIIGLVSGAIGGQTETYKLYDNHFEISPGEYGELNPIEMDCDQRPPFCLQTVATHGTLLDTTAFVFTNQRLKSVAVTPPSMLKSQIV